MKIDVSGVSQIGTQILQFEQATSAILELSPKPEDEGINFVLFILRFIDTI